ncbi:MAG TPA: hypothetical protein VF656_16595 [Pyrinomonadaceae bacterium]
MRWKLLIITSLVAALLSAAAMYVFTFLLAAYLTAFDGIFPLYPGLLIISLGITTLACIFVYRHTARRRKLQAVLTALISLVLTIVAVYVIARIVFMRAVEVGTRPVATMRDAP